MINFDSINDEILNSKENEISTIADKAILEEFDLLPFIEMSENYEVICRNSANNCLSMSLQARKIRQRLDKQRSEILRPHQDFIKAINKQSKDYIERLEEIENSLSDKILLWLENPNESETTVINVDDGSLFKKCRTYFEVENLDLVPRLFLKLDEKKIEEAIKKGAKIIPGIKLFNKNEIDLRVKNT